MNKKNLLVFLAPFLIGQAAHGQDKPCQPTKHAKLPAVVKMTYHKARPLLLAAGWQPLQTKSANSAADDPDIAYGNGEGFWRKGYVEVEACAGTGVAACAFLFKDVYGNKLRVTTAGEELPRIKAFARINGYRLVCD